MKKGNKKIIWISGRCGYGKTAFANSIIKEYEEKGENTCNLEAKDFVDFLVKNLRIRNSIEDFVSHFQNYDLLMLDDVDYYLLGKPATQKAVKEAIQKIINNNTKVILITQKRARKLRKLKFDSDICFYKRLKTPTVEFKRSLIKDWLKTKKSIISKEKTDEIIDKSNNLFQLKGLFNQISFFQKHNK